MKTSWIEFCTCVSISVRIRDGKARYNDNPTYFRTCEFTPKSNFTRTHRRQLIAAIYSNWYRLVWEKNVQCMWAVRAGKLSITTHIFFKLKSSILIITLAKKSNFLPIYVSLSKRIANCVGRTQFSNVSYLSPKHRLIYRMEKIGQVFFYRSQSQQIVNLFKWSLEIGPKKITICLFPYNIQILYEIVYSAI